MNFYRTPLDCAVVHKSGGSKLPSGTLVTALPLVAEGEDRLLAHVTYKDGLWLARRHGAELIHYEVVEELHHFAKERGTELKPVILPDQEIIKATPPRMPGETEKAYYARLYRPMASIEWCRKADGRIFDQLDRVPWDGHTPCGNVGKHHQHGAPPGRCYIRGWWVEATLVNGVWVPAHFIQAGVPPHQQGKAPGPHGEGQCDYATTVVLQWASGKLYSIPEPQKETVVDDIVLKPGSTGEPVKRWQRVVGVEPDAKGTFGPKTIAATKAWQTAHGFAATGEVTSEMLKLVLEETPTDLAPAPASLPPMPPLDHSVMENIPYVPAKHFTAGRKGKGLIDLIVIHDMEAAETLNTAENVALYFKNQPALGTIVNGKPWKGSSCHYNVDANSIVQCVHDADTAWHAKGANHNGIGIEHAGYAKQTEGEWLDEYSLKMLRISAVLTAHLCVAYAIPVVRLSVEELAAGGRGIVSHGDVTRAFKVMGGHTDPGPNFPWDLYLSWVREALGEEA